MPLPRLFPLSRPPSPRNGQGSPITEKLPPVPPGSCDTWKLHNDVTLDTRLDEQTGGAEYFACMDTSAAAVYSLVNVLPLVEKVTPHFPVYTEGATPVPISPYIDLQLKTENSWHLKYSSLRISSAKVSISEGFEPGRDALRLPFIEGFASEWDGARGVLTVTAADSPAEKRAAQQDDLDYEDGLAEDVVDVSDFLAASGATATPAELSRALRLVTFETSNMGSSDSRTVTLAVVELLTSNPPFVVAWVKVINTPDAPEVHISAAATAFVREKQPFARIDPAVEVRPRRRLGEKGLGRGREGLFALSPASRQAGQHARATRFRGDTLSRPLAVGGCP